ncbi:hypothetical protein CEXT_79921 [Caerostris extrusa]|uniref:Uncharacterized protein n=1 Tax=Caerostris extrusa TaxID=172846 RepID=A0AAV4TGN4_CAEEX|nr:hypothetical protein CEXT_79921 [Caerostris extrusa]
MANAKASGNALSGHLRCFREHQEEKERCNWPSTPYILIYIRVMSRNGVGGSSPYPYPLPVICRFAFVSAFCEWRSGYEFHFGWWDGLIRVKRRFLRFGDEEK